MGDRSHEAWSEVDKRFSEFGHIVAERYRKAGEERGDAPAPEEARRKLEEAFSALTRQLDQTFTSVGETVRDQQARDTLKEAGKALVDALSSTVSEVGDQIRKRRPGTKDDVEGPASD
jgi:hypothetical protein